MSPKPLTFPAAGPVSGARPGRPRLVKLLASRRRKQALMGALFPVIVAAGWVFPLAGFFIPLCMVLGLGLAAFRGRTWCDWLCPRGSFEDAWLARLSRQTRIPEFFRRAPLRLAVLAFLMAMLTWQLLKRWPDPYAIGAFFVLLLTVTTGVAVVLGMIYQQRAWCYLCPIGTLAHWLGKNRRPLTLAAERCTACQLCTRGCPMQLQPAVLKAAPRMPHGGDCLKCGLCVAACPRQALDFAEAA
ncbi:MAG: 4Fe-4S binding protein [Syntrophobacterales bacterium]|nr:4Fe-4S binding protein [Syntrophobacterales bacterium]